MQTLRDLVRVVLTLTVVGVVISALQLVSARDGDETSSGPVLRTPYGLAEVGDVTVSTVAPDAAEGMTGKDTGAAAAGGHAAHSGASASAAGMRVTVPITLENRSDDVVRYDPGQFRLSADGRATPPHDGAQLTGELRPDAAVSLRLSFELPAGVAGARLVLADSQPVRGLDLQLPDAAVPAQQMSPQEQPAEEEAAEHATSAGHAR